jgi:uncharacterized protein (TIGR03067 family)
MRLGSLVVTSLVVGLFVGACNNAQTGGKELGKLQGTWEITEITDSGRPVPEDKFKGATFVFRKDTLTMIGPDGKKEGEYGIRVDFPQQPQAMDLVGPGSKYMKEEITPAVYELKGDTMRICIPRRGAPRRPTAFESPPRSGMNLVTLKRSKE